MARRLIDLLKKQGRRSKKSFSRRLQDFGYVLVETAGLVIQVASLLMLMGLCTWLVRHEWSRLA